MGPPERKKMAVESATSTPIPIAPQSNSAAGLSSTVTAAPTTTQQYESIRIATLQLAHELNAFCATHTFQSAPIQILPEQQTTAPPSATTDAANANDANSFLNHSDPITDLQLQVCRKLRELLPTSNCAALLHTAQVLHWIPVLLQWLNLHDRPAVQVEALLAVTSIAEFCASPASLLSLSAPSDWNTPVTAAQPPPISSAMSTSTAGLLPPPLSASSLPYMMPPAAGSVPFPPLSFSQTLSREAVAAFDASLATTIQTSRQFIQQQQQLQQQLMQQGITPMGSDTNGSGSNEKASISAKPDTANATAGMTSPYGTMGGAPYSPFLSSGLGVGGGGINFTPLAPPPGGSHAVSSSTFGGNTNGSYHAAYLPPPTPVVQPQFDASNNGMMGKGTNDGGSANSILNSSIVPHGPVSAASQHVLLRHADAIPTLIALLSSPTRHVYEQALWILGSIAAGDAPPPGTNSSSSSSSSMLDGGRSMGSSGNSHHSSSHHGSSGSNNNNHHGSGSPEKTVSARDVILAAGVMQPLLRCLEAHPNNLSLQRIGAWTLSNLLDNIFQPSSSSSSSAPQQQPPMSSMPSSSMPPTSASTLSSLTQHQQSAMNPAAAAAAAAAASASALSALSANPNISSAVMANPNFYMPPAEIHKTLMNSKAAAGSDYCSSDEIDMNQLLPVLHRLLHMTDSEVLSYICWSLSYLCDGPASHIAAVVTTPPGSKAKPGGLVPRLVELLLHPSWRVTKPALRTIGNIVCAECSDESGSGGSTITTDYTEVILECQAVPRLKELITHSNREIQKEAAWTLSNIAAGTVEQIQAVIDSGAIPPLVNLVRDDRTDQEVRSEACWVVLNATSCGSDAQIELLVDEGCVSVLGVLLSEASMVLMALEGLERVLQVEETREIIRREQIENGELEDDEENRTPVLVNASLIEHARESHNSSAVIKRADRIWKQHFVSCALCKESFSRHRISDATFCEECKCHVCSNCNCKVYHLDYQEELWAATEEQTEAKKNAKKSKNKKKKAKLKEKKASTKQVQAEMESKPESLSEPSKDIPDQQTDDVDKTAAAEVKFIDDGHQSPTPSQCEAGEDDDDKSGSQSNSNNPHNHIDLVLYLQQTGSIIALSKLMDALDYGGDDYDDELDDYERKMIREQQIMRGQAI